MLISEWKLSDKFSVAPSINAYQIWYAARDIKGVLAFHLIFKLCGNTKKITASDYSYMKRLWRNHGRDVQSTIAAKEQDIFNEDF